MIDTLIQLFVKRRMTVHQRRWATLLALSCERVK